MRPVRNAAVFTGILVAAFATRWPFRARLLYHLDEIQFALAIDDYDVTVHQPHPPGYFIYVMLGRGVNLFVRDPHVSLQIISITATAAATYFVWRLTDKMFGRLVGTAAAILYFFSPLILFEGEVGLSYIAGGAVTVWFAYECWEVMHDERRPSWRAGLLLAVAGGIRQNLLLFMFPMLVYAVRRRPIREKVLTGAVMLLCCGAWVWAMLVMTGGWYAYYAAINEYWRFAPGGQSVVDIGWSRLLDSLIFLLIFFSRGLAALLPFLVIGIHGGLRKKGLRLFRDDKIQFLLVWFLPAVLFYTLIFLSSSNQGYIVDILPPLIMIAVWGVFDLNRVARGLAVCRGRSPQGGVVAMFAVLVSINVGVFLFSHTPASAYEVRGHDKILSEMVAQIRLNFDPADTLIEAGDYYYYGFRHAMYYLPEFTVVSLSSGPGGAHRQVFWGKDRRTRVTHEFEAPKEMRTLVTILDPRVTERLAELERAGLRRPAQGDQGVYRYGPITLLEKAYPFYFHDGESSR